MFVDGRIVQSGGPELADKLEEFGYEEWGVSERQRRTGEADDSDRRRQTDENEIVREIGSDYASKYGFHNSDSAEDYFFKSGRGLSHELVEAISEHKNEPEWMRKFRHASLDNFKARPLPTWGGDVSGSTSRTSTTTSSRPRSRPTPGRTCRPTSRTPGTSSGIPEAEKKYLAGVGAQYESEVVYHKISGASDQAGRDLPRHGLGAPRARGARQAVLRDDHPARTTTSSPR